VSESGESYEIIVTPSATRDLKAIKDGSLLARIDKKIEKLASNPRSHDSEKLSGEDNLHRVRVGSYRIVYQVDDKKKTVAIAKVRDRKDVYKR